jgi:phosphohistidine swiveling domain-containing protein
MKFSTKSKNLQLISNLKLKESIIPKFRYFSVQEWQKKKIRILDEVNQFLDNKISIRSSYFLEDNLNSSMAGEFEGFQNVKNDRKKIEILTNKLIIQYKKKNPKKKYLLNSEILYQNFLNNSTLSGVVTNYCLKDGSDYYVINYDDSSNKTDTVTSGGEKSSRVIYIYKKNTKGLRSANFLKIIKAIKEIESKISSTPIDVEFAIDKEGKVNIFQIRPLSTIKNWKKFHKKKFYQYLNSYEQKFIKITKQNKIFGNKPIFGLMPDWNPAEIIGYHPSKLSYSLYRNIITDNSWAKARKLMGYHYVNSNLMYDFAGKPYIDTRLSFNSFIPNEIDKSLRLKIVNFWSNKLINKPYLHDKIEFDIIDGSFDASLKKKINKEYNFLNFNEKKKYFRILKDFTNDLIVNHVKEFESLDRKLKILENERIKLINFYLFKKKINKKSLYNFIIKLKKLGTIPFSIYARHAFISKKIFNSFIEEGVISQKTYNKLLNSVGTITNKFIALEKKIKFNKNYKKKFINYFYHLRPGTYDIEINRYNNSISNYKIDQINEIFLRQDGKKLISRSENHKIKNFLKIYNLKFSNTELINYFLNSIKMRENSKFIFTRSLSDLIEILKNIGVKNKISVENLAKLDLHKILNLSKTTRVKLLNQIKRNEIVNLINNKIKLPYLITNKSDFYVASILLSKPNFITKKIVESIIVTINSNRNEISNKIVLIENADPGYDWIFSKKIKGLITKFGGVNSHMSIRCEELNIPAAIGVGEDNYNNIINYSKIILNCRNQKIIQINKTNI